MSMPSKESVNRFCHSSIGFATIDNKLYTLYTPEMYIKNYDTASTEKSAVVVDGCIMPVLPDADKASYGISISRNKPYSFGKLPKETSESYTQYTLDGNDKAIDYREINSINKYMAAVGTMKKSDTDIITSPDNIFQPSPTRDDSPAMFALKQAVCEKHIDIDKYEMRFGSNFNNDKRLFNKTNISLPMLTRLCDGLDIKATLILEDSSESTPNPIGRKISAVLTGGGLDVEE